MPLPFTTDQFLALGLELQGPGFRNWHRCKLSVNIDDFKSFYGASPKSCEDIWSDLLTAGKLTKKDKPKHLLLALFWLRTYPPNEKHVRAKFGWREKTCRKWRNRFLKKLKWLCHEKINSTKFDDEPLVLFMSIDGTHCPIEEPTPFSKIWSSYKIGGKPAYAYEIGILIRQDQIAWINGPFPGSFPDKKIFSTQGLLEKIPVGKKAVADDGYEGYEEFVSMANDFDPSELAEFKARVKSRQETINKRIKIFKCLETRFRHGMTMHGLAMRAVCVVVQYEIENGAILFDPYPARANI